MASCDMSWSTPYGYGTQATDASGRISVPGFLSEANSFYLRAYGASEQAPDSSFKLQTGASTRGVAVFQFVPKAHLIVRVDGLAPGEFFRSPSASLVRADLPELSSPVGTLSMNLLPSKDGVTRRYGAFIAAGNYTLTLRRHLNSSGSQQELHYPVTVSEVGTRQVFELHLP